MVCAALVVGAPARAALLDKVETLTVLVVDAEGRGSCEPWRVDPEKHQLIGKSATRTYSIGEDRVNLDTITDDRGTHSCHISRPAHDHPDALVVDGASWFRDPKACATALAKRDPVAMDLGDCDSPPVVTDKQLATTRARFEGLLAHGGTVFAIAQDGAAPRCEAVTVRVDRDRADPGQLAASFVSVYEDAQVRVTTAIPYTMAPGDDTLDRFNAVITTVEKKPSEIGTGRYGCLCIDQQPLGLAPQSFDLDATYYFSRARCTAVIAAESARLAWRPPPEKRWDW